MSEQQKSEVQVYGCGGGCGSLLIAFAIAYAITKWADLGFPGLPK